MSVHRLSILVCLGALSGCSVPATEIVLVVRTDLTIGAALSSLKIEARTPSDSERPDVVFSSPSCVRLGPDAHLPPIVFGLVLDGQAKRFTVAVKGYATSACDAVVVVQRSATIGFVSEQTRLLELDLLAACVDKRCPASQTCGPSGDCTSDELTSLPPFDPAQLPDGSDPIDGLFLPRDGGSDR